MSAYLIVMREGPLLDEEAMAEYQRRTRQLASKIALKPLALYGELIPLEGEAPDAALVLEFGSVEDARAWYNAPDYQAALQYRLKSAEFRSFIINGR
ncbi:MAG: DUF1330 domain-containing protein [Halieaceae bacterium]|nr:DUF1330 domain-containing protein [Halieaceae bacterium]